MAKVSLPASIIKDPSLAPEGQRKIRWVEQHAAVLNTLFKKFLSDGTLRDVPIGVCIPLEAKTAYLTLLLHRAGARVALAGTAPGYVQDDVAAAVAAEGVAVFAVADASPAEFQAHLERVVDIEPALLVDDRAELTRALHTTHKHLLKNVWGGSEQTTSGVTKLRNMERQGILAFPMIAGNDALSKHLFDNRYGTGQSVFAALLALTNLYLGGKTVVIAGYGWCGKGLARRAAALNARVVVCEVDPVRALEAYADGFAVLPLAQAAELGDFFITSTGTRDVFRPEHFERMKDGAMLANAGGVDEEIDVPGLARLAPGRREVRRHIEEYRLRDGRRLYLLCQGRLVNIAGGDGHPVEIMDLSFAVQALAIYHIARNRGKLEPRLHRLPLEIDREICRTKLETLGLALDSLTPAQEEFLRQWQ
ncbi:MAG: adenosylhomocysteinase [Acidobacteria bacterium]|nr:adenosylhomocysteinase [Acidobacteriota bacterium]